MDSKQATATRPPHGAPVEVEVEEAEAALVENYRRLVRLAYLTLPVSLGRHRRVVTAHALVQAALPRSRRAAEGAYELVREEVLRGVLEFGGGRAKKWRAMVLPPYVWGLRLHPKAGGADEAGVDRALAGLGAAARAAYLLRELEGLDGRGCGGCSWRWRWRIRAGRCRRRRRCRKGSSMRASSTRAPFRRGRTICCAGASM